MKSKIYLLIGIILIIIPLVFAYVCDDDNNIFTSNIPCEGITPSNMFCSDNVSISYVTNASMNYSINMSLKYPASNTYNFSFNYTALGQYFITLCDNSTANITISALDTTSTGGAGYGANVIPSFIEEKIEPTPEPEIVKTCDFSVKGVFMCYSYLGNKIWPGYALGGAFILSFFLIIIIVLIIKYLVNPSKSNG